MARLIETIKCDIPLPNNKWGAPTPHAMCQLSSPLILSFRRQLGRRKYCAYTMGALAQILPQPRVYFFSSFPSVRDIRIVLCCGLQEHIIPDHLGQTATAQYPPHQTTLHFRLTLSTPLSSSSSSNHRLPRCILSPPSSASPRSSSFKQSQQHRHYRKYSPNRAHQRIHHRPQTPSRSQANLPHTTAQTPATTSSKSGVLILFPSTHECKFRLFRPPNGSFTDTHSGYYLTTRFIGAFTSSTGDFPWLNITGSVNGRPEREPLYYSPLCDIDVFQEISVPTPGSDDKFDQNADTEPPRMHRACPRAIQKGYVVVSSPPMPLTPQTVPEGKYELRAEAMTQDGKRIFCVEGSFDVTT